MDLSTGHYVSQHRLLSKDIYACSIIPYFWHVLLPGSFVILCVAEKPINANLFSQHRSHIVITVMRSRFPLTLSSPCKFNTSIICIIRFIARCYDCFVAVASAIFLERQDVPLFATDAKLKLLVDIVNDSNPRRPRMQSDYFSLTDSLLYPFFEPEFGFEMFEKSLVYLFFYHLIQYMSDFHYSSSHKPLIITVPKLTCVVFDC